MCTVVQLCLVANYILLMRKRNHAFLLLVIALVRKWQIASSSVLQINIICLGLQAVANN